MVIWELKMGIKAAYEQCHERIVNEKSWESLLWAQPFTNAECLCVCLKYTYYKHRSLFNKAFNSIPKSVLVLRPWSASQELFGIANWHSYTPASSGRYGLDQGDGSSEAELNQLTRPQNTYGQKSSSASIKGQEISICLHGGLKLCEDVPPSSWTKWKGCCVEMLIPDHRRGLLLQ